MLFLCCSKLFFRRSARGLCFGRGLQGELLHFREDPSETTVVTPRICSIAAETVASFFTHIVRCMFNLMKDVARFSCCNESFCHTTVAVFRTGDNAFTSCIIVSIIRPILAVDRFDCSASLRTSSATTANPFPCSPARAASIAAFKAKSSSVLQLL